MIAFLRRRRLRKLEQSWRDLLQRARDVQRSGDLKRYAAMLAEAEQLERRLDEMRTAVEPEQARRTAP